MLYTKANMGTIMTRFKAGFTIIELLVVVVVIGILAGIIVISYNGVANNTYKTTQKGDLQSGLSKLERFKSDNGKYPTTLSELTKSLTSSDNSAFTYTYDAPTDTFCLSLGSTHGNVGTQRIDKEGTVSQSACPLSPPSYSPSTYSGEIHACVPGWPAYTFNFAATTGSSTTYSIASGALPATGTLNTSTGIVSGTAANVSATYNFVVRATNTGGYADKTVTIQEYHNVCP